MLERLVLKKCCTAHESTCHTDVWSSSCDHLRSRGRSGARGLGRSIARSLGRSVARSLDPSVAHSTDRSIARSRDRSLDRSIDLSLESHTGNTEYEPEKLSGGCWGHRFPGTPQAQLRWGKMFADPVLEFRFWGLMISGFEASFRRIICVFRAESNFEVGVWQVLFKVRISFVWELTVCSCCMPLRTAYFYPDFQKVYCPAGDEKFVKSWF